MKRRGGFYRHLSGAGFAIHFSSLDAGDKNRCRAVDRMRLRLT
jgi:hypothetical protein